MLTRLAILGSVFVFIANTHANEEGAKLFKKCMACHGADGYGKKSQKAPMIAGQHEWYIEAQVKAIKSGARSNNNTKKMVPYVKDLSDQDIKNLASYISQLPKKS